MIIFPCDRYQGRRMCSTAEREDLKKVTKYKKTPLDQVKEFFTFRL